LGSGQDFVETVVVDQKGVVLHLDLFDRRLGELDRDACVELHLGERTPARGLGQAEDVGQETSGLVAVVRGQDAVIEGDGHGDILYGMS
jgi:hypothetical protein